MSGGRMFGAVLGISVSLAFGAAAAPRPAAAASTGRLGSVIVQTVPSLAGVVVRLDGVGTVTGQAGQATFSAVPLSEAATRVSVKTQVVCHAQAADSQRVHSLAVRSGD